MTMHHPLHRCQPYPRPLQLLRTVQTLKRSKELLRIRHLKTRPVVRDVVDGDAPLAAELLVLAELYLRLGLLLFCELPRVAYEVDQRYPEEPRVSPDLKPLLG